MERSGIIALFAHHPVAGNLLMCLMILFGIYGVNNLNRQVLPDFTSEVVRIDVQWPGASPEDIESNVLSAIEPEVRFIENVDSVNSSASEGVAQVSVRFESGSDISRGLSDVQAAVARITTFPSDMERPVISQMIQSDDVCRLEISGPYSEAALKRIARRIRDDLLDRGLTRIDLSGYRDTEIWVEFDEDTLRRLDLTVSDVAGIVDRSSADLPAGSIETGGVSRQIRSEALARTAAEVGAIEIIANATGERLQLRDIATIRETHAENGVSHLVDGQTAVGLWVGRAKGIDSIDAQRIMEDYLEQLRPQLPPTLRVEMYDVFADQATQRVNMLLSNGMGGLLLVLAVLYLFLNGRVAFWVAAGIPISIMATLGGMAVLGLTLNMISMFAIIMGLGIIVDDAIVVAEHTEMLHRRGMGPEEATTEAARRMFAPVMAASLTTIAAFFPIMMLGATVGKIVRELPITIILVIIASLIECFLVLPIHLRGALRRLERAGIREPGRFHRAFNHFRDTRFAAFSAASYRHRYSTVLATLCVLVISLTLMISGRVGFDFFPQPETDMVFGNVTFTPGTPRERTAEMVAELARAARSAEERLTGGEGGLIAYQLGTVGSTEGREGESVARGDHAGAYTVELIPGDNRSIRTQQFIEAWRDEIRPFAGVEKLQVYERTAAGPPGRDLDIRLHGADLGVLKAAAVDFGARLKGVPGVTGVEDNLPYGKQEIVIELTPRGRALGFTAQDAARQVRDAFEGAIAKRFPRDQEEVIVRVKLAETGDAARTMRDLYLRSRDGVEVPLTEIVELRTKVGFAQVQREDGLRQVSVLADINPAITTTNEVLGIVSRDIAPEIRRAHGVEVQYAGKAEEQAAAIGDMRIAVFVALATMYIILAWVFSSYSTPLVVMAIIPFGLIGAIVGHWVMGFSLNMLSLQALLGLSGVMINDSIILVTAIRRAREAGADLEAAVLAGARERLRPVLLTTLTTIGGLLPLLFERSLQAQLVQPLAVTLIFGLLLAPPLVLCFVPALLGIGGDIGRRRRAPGRAAAEGA